MGVTETLRTHCPAGHPYSGDNLVIRRNGDRRCRTCRTLQQRDWRASSSGQAAKRQSRRAELAAHHHHAREAVRNAVAAGRLVRLPCRDCGASNAEAHHYLGYDPEHRLDVEWLCKYHHSLAHGVATTPKLASPSAAETAK